MVGLVCLVRVQNVVNGATIERFQAAAPLCTRADRVCFIHEVVGLTLSNAMWVALACFVAKHLQARGHTDTRARMSRALNDALSICDRAGRKRRGGDFVLGVRIKDIAGGRLGYGRADEERLRRQKRRCVVICDYIVEDIRSSTEGGGLGEGTRG